MQYLIKTWFGIFVINERLEIKEKFLYPKDVEKLVQTNLDEEEKKLKEFQEKYEEIKSPPRKLEKKFKNKKLEEFTDEYRSLANDFFKKLSQEKIKKGFSEKGESIIRSVNLLNDLNKSINILEDNINDFIQLFDGPEDIESTYKKYEKKDSPTQKEETIKQISKLLIEKRKTRKKLTKYIKAEMKEFAPNTSKIAGEILGAKLISLAGGLKKLATKPSGTIQVLGAEKALFRHLRDGSAPPKHGIIFEHPYVRNTHWDKRGKIARALASKIAIATRIDYFSKKDKSREIKEELNQRLEEVRKNS
ncbi:hypothetical protein C9439_06690 [archaeon SCG-AAA382B04]|nr:hypothetical protein C9439_06690 [archaeon SCG-AAA382B04]